MHGPLNVKYYTTLITDTTNIKYPTDERLTTFILSTTHIFPNMHQFKTWTLMELSFFFNILNLYNLTLWRRNFLLNFSTTCI